MNTTRTVLSTAAAILLASALPLAAGAKTQDVAIWTVNAAKSKLGPTQNQLVIEPGRVAKTAQAQGDAANFLVIANGKVYLATDESAATPTGIRPVDYAHWSDMKLTEIGDHVQSSAVCGFRCQSGLPESRSITLSFRGKGFETAQALKNSVVVLGSR